MNEPYLLSTETKYFVPLSSLQNSPSRLENAACSTYAGIFRCVWLMSWLQFCGTTPGLYWTATQQQPMEKMWPIDFASLLPLNSLIPHWSISLLIAILTIIFARAWYTRKKTIHVISYKCHMPFIKDSLEVELSGSKNIGSRAEVVHARTDLSKLLQQFRELMGLRWGPPFTREMLPTFQMSSCHGFDPWILSQPASHHTLELHWTKDDCYYPLGHGSAELCPTALRKSLLVHFCAPCPQIGGWVGPGEEDWKRSEGPKVLWFFLILGRLWWQVLSSFCFWDVNSATPEVLHYPYCGLPASECTECTSAEPATHVIDIHISYDFRMQKMCLSWRGRCHCVTVPFGIHN